MKKLTTKLRKELMKYLVRGDCMKFWLGLISCGVGVIWLMSLVLSIGPAFVVPMLLTWVGYLLIKTTFSEKTEVREDV